MGENARFKSRHVRVETRVLKTLACRNGFWTSCKQWYIQWNAGTACVSECVLKTRVRVFVLALLSSHVIPNLSANPIVHKLLVHRIWLYHPPKGPQMRKTIQNNLHKVLKIDAAFPQRNGNLWANVFVNILPSLNLGNWFRSAGYNFPSD